MTTLQLGPENAQLTLHTGRAGVAAKVGHDLVLGVKEWTASVTVDDSSVTSVEATVQTSSLYVVEGHGGVKPLSSGDIATIEKEARKTLGAAVAIFSGTASGGALTGTLTIGPASQPFTLPFEVHAGDEVEVRAQADVVQSAFGIKPYSAMLGALKLADAVQVRFQATVPA